MANRIDNSAEDTWSEENGSAIDLSWFNRIMTESIHAVFKVVYRNKQGTGAFYQAVDQQNCERSLFITCSHVAPTNSIQDAIDFMNLFYPKLGNTKNDTLLKFKTEHLLCCWTRKCHCIDATVIELNDEGTKYFRDELNITFLKIADANVNELVAILQMSEGKSKFAYGNINLKSMNLKCHTKSRQRPVAAELQYSIKTVWLSQFTSPQTPNLQ